MPRIFAPVTAGVATSTSYLGAADEFWICGARSLQVGFFLEGEPDTLVAGTLKILYGSGSSEQIQIPAGNLWTFEAPAGEQLPIIQLDAKADAGTPRLALLVL